jgi:aromatic-L-amino-acid/L-tryptophan decarboxylase
MLGELYSATFTAAAFNWICSPACTELETIVMDVSTWKLGTPGILSLAQNSHTCNQWLAKLLGLPDSYLSTGPTLGGGVLHGTASEAVHVMMVAAADRHLRCVVPEAYDPAVPEADREDALAARRGRLVALASSAAHSGSRKAARILGLRFRSIPVGADTGHRLTGVAVRDALDRCRGQGLEPFFLTVTIGTTDTCAVDDLAGIASTLSRDPGPDGAPPVWVHVDAAYAGAALVCPELRAAAGTVVAGAAAADGSGSSSSSSSSSPLERFDSFNFNAHKWLLVNNDASCAWVRDRRPLVAALGGDAAAVYRNAFSDSGLVTDYRDWSVALGRRFRALKIWFVLRSYGAAGLRAYIRRGVGLGERFARGVGARRDLFEVLTGPVFALTVFAVVGGDGGERDARTEALYEAVNASGRAWVTSTRLEGRLAIRVMTANRLTEERHVDGLLEMLVQAAETIVRG